MNWDILGLWPSHSPISRLLLLTNHHCIAKWYTWDPFMCGVPCPSQPCKISTWPRKHQQALSENRVAKICWYYYIYIIFAYLCHSNCNFWVYGIPVSLVYSASRQTRWVQMSTGFDLIIFTFFDMRRGNQFTCWDSHINLIQKHILKNNLWQTVWQTAELQTLSSFIDGSHSSILSKKTEK